MSNGTTDFQTLCATIAEWANRSDWSQALVASFVAMAEQKLNADLRVDRMVTQATNTATLRCATLPDDWLEMEFVVIANGNTPNGWLPLRYKARDQFFNQPDKLTYGFYTLEGRTITFGGTPDDEDGIPYQIWYFQEVPAMATIGSSWVYTKYPRLYLLASLMNADLHAQGEEQVALLLGQQVDQMIAKLNDNYRLSKASGSRLKRTRIRTSTFG
jgi:hypothetical protein